jgi:hypothetical protein
VYTNGTREERKIKRPWTVVHFVVQMRMQETISILAGVSAPKEYT